jgi:uncharacterized RDD family membrane protein YckC
VCKRCGHIFAAAEDQPAATADNTQSSVLDAPLISNQHGSLDGSACELPMQRAGQPWQDEIVERVARHRRRRSRVHDAAEDDPANLEFDFSGRRGVARTGPPASTGEWREDEFDAVLGGEASWRNHAPALDSVPIEGAGNRGFRAEGNIEWAVEPAEVETSPPAPVEVVLNSGSQEEGEPEPAIAGTGRLAAPIGRRMAAALVDALVLLIAACVFTLVFAKTGGEVNPRPSNVTIVVLVTAAASLVTFYFALFTALAFATPGQSALGLRVRTLDDRLPDSSAAIWRGVGYLVSAAALMLGFIWAVFDSDGLTWHDHMSGTCLALRAEVTDSS